MSGLQEFLTPFSHLIFANRDKVIVLLAVLLGWFTIQLLISRWRNERLERDLSTATRDGIARRDTERPLGRTRATATIALGLSGGGRAADARGTAQSGPVLPAATAATAANGPAPIPAAVGARTLRSAPNVRTTGI